MRVLDELHGPIAVPELCSEEGTKDTDSRHLEMARQRLGCRAGTFEVPVRLSQRTDPIPISAGVSGDSGSEGNGVGLARFETPIDGGAKVVSLGCESVQRLQLARAEQLLIEELGAEFSLGSAEVVNRIEKLQEMGKLNGILDERGKYIMLTDEEWEKVARCI